MKDKTKFKKWLTKRGAVVGEPTNDWEIIRFKTGWGTSIIYQNKSGNLTFTGESRKAYDAYRANKAWRGVDRKRQQLRAKKAQLAARDGKKCFFHGELLPFDQLTIEHWVAFSHGGTDHDSNLCLACEPCNRTVANLPITKKIAFRDKKIAEAMDARLIAAGIEEGLKHPDTAAEMRAIVVNLMPGGDSD